MLIKFPTFAHNLLMFNNYVFNPISYFWVVYKMCWPKLLFRQDRVLYTRIISVFLLKIFFFNFKFLSNYFLISFFEIFSLHKSLNSSSPSCTPSYAALMNPVLSRIESRFGAAFNTQQQSRFKYCSIRRLARFLYTLVTRAHHLQ